MSVATNELADENVTREDLAECLRHLSYTAKRKPNVVAKFTDDPPTEWDTAHERINKRIDQYRSAP